MLKSESPAPETEGPVLDHTADCKTSWMRPGERNVNQAKPADKPAEKRMECVAGTCSKCSHLVPHEVIVESFYRPTGPRLGLARLSSSKAFKHADFCLAKR